MSYLQQYICKKCNTISYLGDVIITSPEEQLGSNAMYSKSSTKDKICKHQWKKAKVVDALTTIFKQIVNL